MIDYEREEADKNGAASDDVGTRRRSMRLDGFRTAWQTMADIETLREAGLSVKPASEVPDVNEVDHDAIPFVTPPERRKAA